MNVAAERGIDYNLFELFDEPWKAGQEGTVGAHWGMLDADRRMKFPLTGPVSEMPNWFTAFCLSSALGALLALLAFGLRRPVRVLAGVRVMRESGMVRPCQSTDSVKGATAAATG